MPPQYYGVSLDQPKVLQAINEALGDDENWARFKRLGKVNRELHVTLAHFNDVKKGTFRVDSYSSGLNKILRTSAPVNSGTVSSITKRKVQDLKGAKTEKEKPVVTKVTKSDTAANRWENLGELFDVEVLGADAHRNQRVASPLYFDIKVDKILVVDFKLAVAKIRISDPFQQENGWVQIDTDLKPLNKYLHVTIGTLPGVKPFMSNQVLDDTYKQSKFADGDYLVRWMSVHVHNVNLRLKKQRAFVQF